jgi:hypothetical protein
MFESQIDGFQVRCSVVQMPDASFRVQVHTRRAGSDEEHLCRSPGNLLFDQIEDAQRRARYVLLGVQKVDACGEPRYVVI